MKKINLLLSTSILTTIAGCTPLISCGHIDNYQMSDLTKDIISEMIGDSQTSTPIPGMCSIPRPSKHCSQIDVYLTERIKQIMDDPDYEVHNDQYHNLWCDIPASSDAEADWQPIILQGHVDMVVAGMDEQETWQRPIEPEIDGRLMHSKDHKTSLGADDGHGLAIMLEIMKNRDNFQHGLIRLIMSSDEEVGMIGAHYLNKEAFEYGEGSDKKLIKYLLNIDGENVTNIYRSCFGTARERFNKTYTTPAALPLENGIELRLDGLRGGHSGVDIVKARASADRVIFEFINYLAGQNIQVEISRYDHVKNIGGQDVDVEWKQNQLIENGRIIFYSDKDIKTIKDKWPDFISQIKDIYTGEDINSWTLEFNTAMWSQEIPYISVDDTKNIAQLIGGNRDWQHIEDGLPFGVLAWKDEQKTKPKATANIGPVSVSDEIGSDTLSLSIKTAYRTAINGSTQEQEAPEWSIDWVEPLYAQAGSICDITPKEESRYQPWECKEGINDQMVKFLCEKYKEFGIDYEVVDCDGGIENAEWITKNPGLIGACIGATLKDVHTTGETLYLDTIDTIYNATVETIKWMEQCD